LDTSRGQYNGVVMVPRGIEVTAHECIEMALANAARKLAGLGERLESHESEGQ
jgi:hypothetical protein